MGKNHPFLTGMVAQKTPVLVLMALPSDFYSMQRQQGTDEVLCAGVANPGDGNRKKEERHAESRRAVRS